MRRWPFFNLSLAFLGPRALRVLRTTSPCFTLSVCPPVSLPQSYNQLQDIPTLQCPMLTRLDLSHNQFKVPPDVGFLPQLSEFHIGFNDLSAFPAIVSSNSITIMDVRDNKITTVDAGTHPP